MRFGGFVYRHPRAFSRPARRPPLTLESIAHGVGRDRILVWDLVLSPASGRPRRSCPPGLRVPLSRSPSGAGLPLRFVQPDVPLDRAAWITHANGGCIMPRTLYMIKDTHSEPDGRLKAEHLIESGAVGVYFMEWGKPIDPNDLRTSFTGLAKEDASPTLEDLAETCFANNVAVVPCDLTPEETIARLNELDPENTPFNALSVFQEWGQAVRDLSAADKIAEYLDNHPQVETALLMFGADHFKASDYRKLSTINGTIPPLNELVRARLPGWTCKFAP